VQEGEYNGFMTEEYLSRRRPRGLLRWPIYTMGQFYRPAYARLDAALAEVGLSPRMYQVLVSLDELGGLSQQQVADVVGVDRADMVRILDRLEAASYVVREPDTSDRRRHVLALTPAGHSAIDLGGQIVARVNAEVFAAFPDAERRALHRLLLDGLGEPTDVLGQPLAGQGDGADGPGLTS
jgi:MarR family transcriptional regulator, lower aerobic nicotinate degradation pathway regulator